MHPADLMIIKTAVRLEERRQKEKKKEGKPRAVDRDPTPGLLRSDLTPQPKKEEAEGGEEDEL